MRRQLSCITRPTVVPLLIGVFIMIAPQQAAGVSPPANNIDMPAHVQQAQKVLAREYGNNAVAARLQQMKDDRTVRGVRSADASSSVSVFSVPVILGNYSNVSHLFSAPQYGAMLFGTAPGGLTMHNYYLEVSAGQFTVTGTAYGPFTAAQTQAYYVNGDNGSGSDFPTNASGFIKSVLAAADATVDFAQYDNDGPDGVPNSGDDDGYCDAVIIIVPDGDASGGDSDNMWAHQWSLSSGSGSAFTTGDARFGGGNILVDTYTIQGGEQGDGTWNLIKPIGVFCHEFGHILGLPDLYDGDNSSLGVGTWCLMGLGSWGVSWNSTTENRPVHMSAWCREDLGWITPTVVTSLDSIGVLDNEVIKLWEDAYQGGRYFLVENRVQFGFDLALPGEGLLVWHINEEVSDNSVDNYRIVDLEEMDGLAEIDSKADWMDIGDMLPYGNTTFSDVTNPNSQDVFGVSTSVQVKVYASGPGKIQWTEFTPRALSGFTLYYVGHTWVGRWGFSTPQTNYGAVRFVTPQSGDLVAVRVGAFAGLSENIGIRIFNDMVGSSPSGLLLTTSGVIPSYSSSRYHEVTLPSSVPLTAGQTFLVDGAWGPSTYAVKTVYRSPHSGQSYFSQLGSTYTHWTDKDVAIRAVIAFPSCPITLTGDVNNDGSLTSADIIALVNYVFKGGSVPMPCAAAGDVNCDGSVTSADIIYMVNYVFKGGAAPCDVCALIPATWTCP